MLYAAALQLLEKPIPSVDQAGARKKQRQALGALLFLAALPLFVSFGVLFFICLPATVTVLETSTFRIWDFDLQETLFVFLELGVAASLCIVGWLGITLLNKRCGTFST
jgi:hypothetical protein